MTRFQAHDTSTRAVEEQGPAELATTTPRMFDHVSLTEDFTANQSEPVNCAVYATMRMLCMYGFPPDVNGDPTNPGGTLELMLEFSDDGVYWYKDSYISPSGELDPYTAESGLIPIWTRTLTYDPAVSGNIITPELDCGAEWIRVNARELGTASGTLTMVGSFYRD